jgi:MerR family transcriptional regulator/heat shock protein HspR
MISIAAEIVGMHPQTLRVYEMKGLVLPERSPGGTRLYSEDDIAQLRAIQRLTNEFGINLSGVEYVLGLERRLSEAESELNGLLSRNRRQIVRQQKVIYKSDSSRKDNL